MSADVKAYHKSHMPKVMFLACTARPRPGRGFDGKVEMWSSMHASKETVIGETDIVECVTINTDEYHKWLLQKNGVFGATSVIML